MESPSSTFVSSVQSVSAPTSPTLADLRKGADGVGPKRSKSNSKSSSRPGPVRRVDSDGCRTRASSISSKSSHATVQSLMAFAEQSPYEFEQSILLLRLADSVKNEAEDRARSTVTKGRSRSRHGTGESSDWQSERKSTKTRTADSCDFNKLSLPRGCNCILSI
ncbi:unnamed protein product [Symbiodinium sp. CCMP2592]|nr:unnamed protein product [Symbiodinium sp. CCMP2592]